MSHPQQSAAFEMESASPDWKQEINARLSAHRSRRTGAEQNPPPPGLDAIRRPEMGRAARVAARVADRYAKAPTYSEMLAAEAARAAEAAAVAAEAARVANEAAQAMTAAILARFEQERQAAEAAPEIFALPAPVSDGRAYDQLPVFALSANPDLRPDVSSKTELVADKEPVQYRVHPASLPEQRMQSESSRSRPALQATAEISAGAYTDVFEETMVAPAQPLPVRILEFPRELVAARKARPRHAEGPLREENDGTQLRIFEVEPESISHEPVDQMARAQAPEWHSIRLDAHPVLGDSNPGRAYQGPSRTSEQGLGRRTRSATEDNRPAAGGRSPLHDMLTLHVAPMEDRMMAGIVDLALVMVAFLLFVLVFAACTAHPPIGKGVLAAAGGILIAFFSLYQWLFFTYAEGTPGMRYAKIALCTFDDENPGRRSMRGRIAALLLSALPLGLGFLWALFDEDRLCWHDRITRTYQRSYR